TAGTTIGNSLIYDNGTNVGIGTTGPAIKLAIGDTDTGLGWAGDGQLDLYSNNVNTISIRSGNVGIGTTGPAEDLHVFRGDSDVARIYATGSSQGSGMIYAGQSTSYGGGFSYDGDGIPNIIGGTDRITFFRRSAGIDYEVFSYAQNSNEVSLAGNLNVGGGTGKLTVGTIDPIFEIGGEKYATYVADFAGGVRMETSGTANLENRKYVIDFDKLEKGSDLWLFWQTSNKKIEDVVVLLTSSFEGKVWYEKNGNILTIYGKESGEVSYRLSAPRLDFKKWGNLTEDEGIEGIRVSDY
ncbi:hypothetical protein KKA72_02345, partial [Patescibacteria group bacterium]|nr:hypothetical protein [Patescibacteria group bacterium]